MAGKGRGWHGDSERHAHAGRLGGLKSGRNRQIKAAGGFGEKILNPTDQKTKKT
jgi:hypothetical protein